jgi:transposase
MDALISSVCSILFKIILSIHALVCLKYKFVIPRGLQWLKLVFDPQTKERADHKPRVLIRDGIGTHETLEILEFCFKNNIILCRIPSYTPHKLRACDKIIEHI